MRSPRSPIDPNKPLPSPPPPGTVDKADGQQRAVPKVLKLKRIMATLSDVEIEKLFSGAPQYFARSQGLGTGAPVSTYTRPPRAIQTPPFHIAASLRVLPSGGLERQRLSLV